jgi:hypothetical protein
MHIDPEQRQGFVERRSVEQQESIVRLLRNLPQEVRQPYDWTEFRRRARERTNAVSRAGMNGRRYAAIAAVLLLVIVGAAAWVRGIRPLTLVSVESDDLLGGDRATLADVADARADVEERWLASLPDEPVVVRVGTRAAVAGLEDRIAQIDDLLSAARVEGTQPAKLAAIEQQRARLVNSLVRVRYAETLVSASR